MGAVDCSVSGQEAGLPAWWEPISGIGNQVGVERRECAVAYRFQLLDEQVENGHQGPAISFRRISSIFPGGERRRGMGFPVDRDSSHLRVDCIDQ